jgi:hypothetical protein
MTQELSSNRKSVQAASAVKAYRCVKLQLAEENDCAEVRRGDAVLCLRK